MTDITGQRYGRLVAIERTGCNSRRNAIWRFRCDCGNEIDAIAYNVRTGRTRSCGCLRRETAHSLKFRHGKSHTRIYYVWKQMLRRCHDERDPNYRHYGARGICVSPTWHKFERFYKDMGEPPFKGASIERVDNNRGYFKENCKWATPLE